MRKVLGALLLAASMSAGAVEMMDHLGPNPPPLAADEALIVFVYPPDSGEFVRMSIADVTEPAAKLVGIIEPGSKVLHRAKPGQYLFMLNYARASFLQADLAAGKTYYAVVTKIIPQRASIMNLYTLRAVHDVTEIFFARADRETMPVVKTKKADDWFVPRVKAFGVKKDKFLQSWMDMPADEKAQYTLQQSHGR